MNHRTLEDKLLAAGGVMELARDAQVGPYFYNTPPEYSNWRDEQIAWRETVALLDLSHHMTDLSIEGPDALRLLSDLGINSFANFKVNRAKQFVCCNPEGYVIGDGILFYLNENKISLLGLPAAHNWVQYHAQSGRYDVTVQRDNPTAINPAGKRKLYRFQVQGPSALKVLEQATGNPLPDIKFFHMGELKIAGRQVRALRHGMSGAPGLELFGPWEEGARSAPGPTSVLRSNRGGSPVPCRRSSAAASSKPIGSGCLQMGSRATARSAAAFTPATSKTTTSRRTNSATGLS
jgi:vanillate/3-O-methylgallate O-demethylase